MILGHAFHTKKLVTKSFQGILGISGNDLIVTSIYKFHVTIPKMSSKIWNQFNNFKMSKLKSQSRPKCRKFCFYKESWEF